MRRYNRKEQKTSRNKKKTLKVISTLKNVPINTHHALIPARAHDLDNPRHHRSLLLRSSSSHRLLLSVRRSLLLLRILLRLARLDGLERTSGDQSLPLVVDGFSGVAAHQPVDRLGVYPGSLALGRVHVEGAGFLSAGLPHLGPFRGDVVSSLVL